MSSTESIQIYCPNCGHSAERFFLLNDQLTRTQCAHCDYLMITCDRTGKVIEAYAPGYSAAVGYAQSTEARNCPQAASASNPRE